MICFVPNCAFLSETTRAIAIHHALRARGVETCFATHGGPYTRVLDQENVPWTMLGPGWTEERSRRFVASIPGISPPTVSLYEDSELRAHVDREVTFFRERGVKAVVTGFALSTLLSTRVAKIPLVTDHAGSWVPPVAERGLFPIPKESTMPLARFFPERLGRWLSNQLPSRTKMFCGTFNRVARELGVEGVPSFAALLLGDLTLVTDCEEVLGVSAEALEQWKPGRGYRAGTKLKYVGPLFAELAAPLPARVERFLDGEADKKRVYVAMTSTPEALVRRVVETVRGTGARVVVASTVHALDDLAGDDVVVEPILPSQRVMPRCDLAVIAGGQGSVQTAMAFGTPFIGIPLQPEQDFNIVEMERHGAAVRISKKEAMNGRLAPLVDAMTSEPRYRDAARRVQAVYAKADGPRACADAIVEAFNP